MKEFTILIKSHCAAPDYEDSVIAESREDAAEKFSHYNALVEFTQKDLLNYVDDGREI